MTSLKIDWQVLGFNNLNFNFRIELRLIINLVVKFRIDRSAFKIQTHKQASNTRFG
jgi:hypothetical protein